jgi:hypothetical protein
MRQESANTARSTLAYPTLAYPTLAEIVSLAVGFRCEVFWIGLNGPGGRGTAYQVTRADDGPGPGKEFWDWHIDHEEQFHATPEEAVLRFIQAFRRVEDWSRCATQEARQ